LSVPDPQAKALADNRIPVGRSLLFVLAGVLVMDACAGGGVASRAEPSASAIADGRSAGTSPMRVATAGSEAGGSDWTATVRTLGDAGGAPARELPGSEPMPPAQTAPAPAPMRLSQRGTATSAGASSATDNPAVASLVDTASAQSRAGDHARAAATLERAIGIEPNNAWLWHRLANTRLREGRLEQAASLAAKSNSLAGADRSLQADNWKLIAAVRRHFGDTGAAASAESRAATLSK
jgi:tetratricopeptide (TPR) repeat protein